MRLAERLLQTDAVVAVHEADAQRRRDQVLGLPLLLLDDIFTINDVRNMASDSCVRSYIHKLSLVNAASKSKKDKPMPFLSIKLTKSASVR